MITAVGILGFLLLVSICALVFQHFAHMSDMDKAYSRAFKANLDMAEKVKTPDSMFVEAIRAQAQPLIPEKDDTLVIDEDWLRSDESLVSPEDDISPIFDPEEF